MSSKNPRTGEPSDSEVKVPTPLVQIITERRDELDKDYIHSPCVIAIMGELDSILREYFKGK